MKIIQLTKFNHDLAPIDFESQKIIHIGRECPHSLPLSEISVSETRITNFASFKINENNILEFDNLSWNSFDWNNLSDNEIITIVYE